MKIKNILLILSFAALFFISSAMAYFSGSDTVTNRLSAYPPQPAVPEILRIDTDEDFDPPHDKSDIYKKDVRIVNTGNVDCFVRARLEFSTSYIENISFFSCSDDKDADTYIPAGDFRNSPPEGWVYNDGFYYYTDVLRPYDSTTSLIKWVKTVFPDDAEDYNIFVYSEAVSAVGNSYEDAWA